MQTKFGNVLRALLIAGSSVLMTLYVVWSINRISNVTHAPTKVSLIVAPDSDVRMYRVTDKGQEFILVISDYNKHVQLIDTTPWYK